jgi:hypothetical protein
VLKEKTTPELLRELEERFADAPGLIDAKKLQKDMYLFYFVKITVLDYNFYKSRDFTLYTIIQQLPELLQLGNTRGIQNRIVRLQALYLKGCAKYYGICQIKKILSAILRKKMVKKSIISMKVTEIGFC